MFLTPQWSQSAVIIIDYKQFFNPAHIWNWYVYNYNKIINSIIRKLQIKSAVVQYHITTKYCYKEKIASVWNSAIMAKSHRILSTAV